MRHPYSTYQAIVTKRIDGAMHVVKAECRDHEDGRYYLEFEDVADFFKTHTVGVTIP